MPGLHEKLAVSLSALKELRKDGLRVFQSKALSRVDRDRLVRNGFLREVMKGWLISASPSVGEIRRVLNSFLTLLEKDTSSSLIVAATNHPEMLDKALFRRFDDVIEYQLPDAALAAEILARKLAMFETAGVEWPLVFREAEGLSHSELSRASEEAAKRAVLEGSTRIATEVLIAALRERKAASH